jgi:hypothetical protein
LLTVPDQEYGSGDILSIIPADADVLIHQQQDSS